MSVKNNLYDVIIIGGSYAGLSAAMALGRSHRKVLIIDAGAPCNIQTPHSHNFLTQDGKTPSEISSLAKGQVLKYPTVTFLQDFVTSAKNENETFSVYTESQQSFTTRKLLLTTGIKDIFPEIKGFKECWGISVVHCPYCHGYEISNSKLAVIGNGDAGFDFVKLIWNWSKDLTLLTHGPSTLSDEQRGKLGARNVTTIENRITNIIHHNGKLEKVEFENGRAIAFSAVFSRVPFTHHSDLARDLGCSFTDANLISVDEFGKTTVPGFYAAGDCCLPARSVSIAVASGTKAGVSINKELIDDAF